MTFRSALKYSCFVAIGLFVLAGSGSATAQTVTATDLGSGNADIYKTINQKVYGFSISSTGGNSTLTALTTPPTGGNYTSTDIVSFELYFNTVDNFATASLVETAGPPAGFGENLNFNSFSQVILDNGSDKYFYIIANVAAGASSGNSFSIPSLDNSNFTWDMPVTLTSTLGPSGTKTIQNQLPFITIWKTDNPGSTADNQITIPTTGTGYNYDIYWEEVGNPSNNGTEPTGQTGNYIITFPSIGIYRVEISGQFPQIYFNSSYSNPKDSKKILSVEQWGDMAWTSMNRAFAGCENLRINATDAPDLSGVTDMSKMFYNASVLNDNINHWDVSTIENMSGLFRDASDFNQPLNTWDVSNVTNMSEMFSGAHAFNQDIKFVAGGANTGGDAWNVSNVRSMSSMFSEANVFNQDIGGWNTTSVIIMYRLFFRASVFNQDISGWNVASVTNMNGMFFSANAFNQDLNGWVVDGVTDMSEMFGFATAFNGSIVGWNVSSVYGMSRMFTGAISFNQDISSWDVSNVSYMSFMFSGATSFNQDISGWEVSNVSFFSSMFYQASSFDQNLGTWDVKNAWNMTRMFNYSGLSADNYDNILIGWAANPLLRSNVTLDAIGLRYCAGVTARDYLISNFNWTINDEGLDCLTVYDGDDTGDPEIFNGQPEIIDFGSYVSGGAGRTRQITINNSTGIAFTNLNIGFTGTTFSVTAAPTSIAGGNSITVDVLFQGPVAGSFTETMTITSDNFPDFGFQVNGVITNTPEPEIKVVAGSTTVGDVITDEGSFTLDPQFRGSNGTNQFTVINNGSSPLNISALSISGTVFTLGTAAPLTIPVGNSETIDITIDGTVAGNFNETLTIINDDTDESIFNFEVNGEIYSPEIALFNSGGTEIFDGQPSPVDFGTEVQGTGINETLTIQNQGAVDLTITGINISGSEFVLNSAITFPLVIGASGNQLIDIFLSGNNIGVFTETVTVLSDDVDEGAFDFPITGDISAVGTVRYVKGDATGNNDGTSWTDAFIDLQDALAASADQDVIWIAAGVYTPDLSAPGNTSLTFNIPADELMIYGGFLGTESQLSERVGDPSLTVLSGDLNGDDGPAFTNTSDNSKNVLTVNGYTVSIDYLTISDGNSPSKGGGILANNAEVNLTNAVVENNQSNVYGGGVYLDGGSIQLYKTEVRNNEAGAYGGGTYISNAEPYLFRAIFESNEATLGAGLYMNNANQVNNSSFYYNQFINNGNNGAVTGGAVFLEVSYYKSFGDLFTGNFAYDAGGAICSDNGGSTILLTNSTFGNNSVNDASADIYFTSTDVLGIYNSILWGATRSDGATGGSLVSINNYPASFEIRNSIVQGWDPSEYSIAPVATNVSASDPLFTDAGSDDFTISDSSPAIDMGDNSYASYLDVEDEDGDMDFSEPAPYDLSGNSRYFNSTIDIGAYENQPASAPEPEIGVFQSSTEIFDGQLAAVDFGSANQGTDIVLQFTISNSGLADLNISNIAITGTAFNITSAIPTISKFDESAPTFDISLSGAVGGTFTETITIESDDSDESVFDFTITGTIVCEPITAGTPSIKSNVGQPTVVDIITSSNATPSNISTVTITQNSSQGEASVNADNTISYVPNAGTIGDDSFEYQICNKCGLCSVGTVSVDILNQPPVYIAPTIPPSIIPGQVITILIMDYLTDPNNNIDLASLTNLTTTGNGIVSYDGNGTLTLDYSNGTFSGSNESISFRIFDTSMAFADVTIAISVEGEIIVHNGISPNGDDKNEFFDLKNIEFLEPENSVHIYNRWGDMVFEMENYDNDTRRFEGRQTNGNFLPSGVYFYKVEFPSGRDPLNGYLTLKL